MMMVVVWTMMTTVMLVIIKIDCITVISLMSLPFGSNKLFAEQW